MSAPVLMKAIPAQVVNERASYGPLNLKEYIQVPEGGTPVRFQGELQNGQPLPKGLICTQDGAVTGIPAKGTSGNYEILITATNDTGSIKANFVLVIKPGLQLREIDYLEKLKTQVWEALGKQMPLPEFNELLDRPTTRADVYYLLERFATLKVWDAYNLDPPGPLVPLQLTGASKHYHVFDRGSCIVASPINIFSHEHTIEDGLKTARAIAEEVYNRQWTIELVGFDKLVRGAWVELRRLGDKNNGKYLEVINFQPSLSDVKLYQTQSMQLR